MKKILSIILCVMFMNLVYCPMALAVDDSTDSSASQQVSAEVSDTAVTDNDAEASLPDDTVTVSAPEKARTEHLQVRKNKSKKIELESVYITSHGVEIPAQDILQIAFVSDFNGRKAHVGDEIEFKFPNEITTKEGSVILPSTTRIVAEITQLKKPKPLHLCGKVYLKFKYIQLPDGTRKDINAKLLSKKDYLARKSLNKGVAVGETVAGYGAGAVAGAAIGGSLGASVFGIILCGTFGAGIGAIAGVTVGILLPGASFKAKAGQTVDIQLTDELDITE